MTNFIKNLLANKNFMLYLFNFDRDYQGSYFAEDMHDFWEYDENDDEVKADLSWYKKRGFIAKNTEWLFVERGGRAFGLLEEKYVVTCDDEGNFAYLCLGFQNIPLFYLNELKRTGDYKEEKEAILSRFGIDLNTLFQQYEQFCKSYSKSYSLELTEYYNEEEFWEYIQQKIS